jgi:MFS family permease
MCIMILELAAGRIIAPYVGSSLYTWTSVIGVVLAGVSLGNYLGGRLADQRPSVRILSAVFVLAALASLLVLGVDQLLAPGGLRWPLLLRVFGVMTAMFLLPCTVLGCVSPLVARLAVRQLAHAGRIVGSIYAVSTLGSIVGTVGTGFWLIPTLRVDLIIVAVTALLLVWGLALWVAGATRSGEGAA